MDLTQNQTYQALKLQYEARKQKALANITVFLKAPVGVADHEDSMGSLMKLVEELASAEDVLYCLETNFEKD